MMDWHYHKDDIYTEEDRKKDQEIRAWQKAGFKTFYIPLSYSDKTLECPKCAAIVKQDGWRKHLKSHK